MSSTIIVNNGEVSSAAFHHLYLPILNLQLAAHPLSLNSPLSRHYLYYSVKENTGVSLKKIQAPQMCSFHTSPTNNKPFPGEASLSETLKSMIKPSMMLSQWYTLSVNFESEIHPLIHYSCEPNQVQYVVPKADQSLEDLIRAKQTAQQTFSSKQILSITQQAIRILALLENSKTFHLNLSTYNFIVSGQVINNDSPHLSTNDDQITIKATDLGAKAIMIRQYFEMLNNYMNSQISPVRKSSQKRYSQLETDNDLTDLVDLNQTIGQFARSAFKHKLDQWLAAYIDTDIYFKCLVSDILKLSNLKDIGKRLLTLFMIFDRIMVVISLLCVIQNKSFDELQADIKLKYEQTFPNATFDLKVLTAVIQNNISQVQTSRWDSQLEEQQKTANNFQVIHNVLKQLLLASDTEMAMNTFTKRDQEQGIGRRILASMVVANPELPPDSESDVDSAMTSPRNSSVEVSPVQVRFINKKEPEQAQPQNVGKLKPVQIEQSIENDEPPTLLVYLTNLPFKASLISKSNAFGDIDFSPQRSNLTEIYNEEQIMLFFRNTATFMNSLSRTKNEIVLIRCSKQALQFFIQNKTAKAFFMHPNVEIVVQFDLASSEEINGWVKLLQGCGQSIKIQCSANQVVGDVQLQKFVSTVPLLSNLTKIVLTLQDNFIKEETTFHTLCTALFAFPRLTECEIDISNIVNAPFGNSGNQYFYSLSINSPDLGQLLAPEAQIRKLANVCDNINKTSALTFLKLNLSQHLDKVHVPFLCDYHKYMPQLNEYSLNLSNITFDEATSATLIESIVESFPRIQVLSLDLSKSDFSTSHLGLLHKLVSQGLQKLSISLAEIKLSVKSCEHIRMIFFGEDPHSRPQPSVTSLKLSLQSCQIRDKGLLKLSEILAMVPKLHQLHLNLEKNSISEEGLQQLIKALHPMQNLRDLAMILRTNHIGQYGLNGLGFIQSAKALKHLSLDVYNNQLQKQGFGVVGVQLAKFVELESISLEAGMNSIEEGFIMILGTFFSQMKVLRKFNLDLELNLFENEPNSQKVEWPLRNLAKTCNLDEISINLKSCGGLKQEFISLFFNVLGCLTSCKVLKLSFSKMDKSQCRLMELFASQLSELKNLVELDIEMTKCKVCDNEIQVLGYFINQLQHLTTLTLNLESNDICKGYERMGDKLGELRKLNSLTLDLSRNPLDKDALQTFFDQLSRRSELEILHLVMRNCNIEDDDIVEISRHLIRMESLADLGLELSGNKIKEKGSAQLGLCLIQIKQLKILRLDLGLRRQQIIYDSTPQYKELKTTKLSYSNFL